MSVELKNVTHIYGLGLPHEQKALDGISLLIEKKEFVGIVGHTGSGKSTLLQHLNGLLKPASGEIIINGKNITDSKVTAVEMRKKTGLVFQYPEYQLFEETVAKDIAFGPKNLGLDEVEIEERVKTSLDLVGLSYEEFKEKSPFELSGGQKRRVAIAGVLAMKPEVLILDEPTAGLDPKSHKETLDMIKKIHNEWGIITIFVSHNMDDVARLCDRVFVIEKGKIFIEGTTREVFAQKEKLESVGLSIPQATSLTNKLVEEGVLGESILESEKMPITTEELLEVLEASI